jgi:hypothetical protein
LVTIRGSVIVIHDRQLAVELLLPAREALAANLSIASPAGAGWRSKLVQKHLLRDTLSSASAAVCGGPASISRSDGEVHAEVQARLDAVAPALRAQILASDASGVNIRSSAGLVPADVHVRASVAKHNFVCGKAFGDLSVAEVRNEQRLFRRATVVELSSSSSVVAGAPEFQDKNHESRRLSMVPSGAAPDAAPPVALPFVAPLPSEAFVVEYQKLILDMRADIEGLASAADFKVFDLNVSWVPACGRIDICICYSGVGPQERHRQVQRAVQDCLLLESASRSLCAHTSWVLQKNQ